MTATETTQERVVRRGNSPGKSAADHLCVELAGVIGAAEDRWEAAYAVLPVLHAHAEYLVTVLEAGGPVAGEGRPEREPAAGSGGSPRRAVLDLRAEFAAVIGAAAGPQEAAGAVLDLARTKDGYRTVAHEHGRLSRLCGVLAAVIGAAAGPREAAEAVLARLRIDEHSRAIVLQEGPHVARPGGPGAWPPSLPELREELTGVIGAAGGPREAAGAVLAILRSPDAWLTVRDGEQVHAHFHPDSPFAWRRRLAGATGPAVSPPVAGRDRESPAGSQWAGVLDLRPVLAEVIAAAGDARQAAGAVLEFLRTHHGHLALMYEQGRLPHLATLLRDEVFGAATSQARAVVEFLQTCDEADLTAETLAGLRGRIAEVIAAGAGPLAQAVVAFLRPRPADLAALREARHRPEPPPAGPGVPRTRPVPVLREDLAAVIATAPDPQQAAVATLTALLATDALSAVARLCYESPGGVMTAPAAAPVSVERVGLVTHLGHRTTIHHQAWVRLVIEHTGALETDVCVFPDRMELVSGVHEGDLIRVRGCLRYAQDPLVPPAIAAEAITVITAYDKSAVRHVVPTVATEAG